MLLRAKIYVKESALNQSPQPPLHEWVGGERESYFGRIT